MARVASKVAGPIRRSDEKLPVHFAGRSIYLP
jgi:hypothetical protein